MSSALGKVVSGQMNTVQQRRPLQKYTYREIVCTMESSMGWPQFHYFQPISNTFVTYGDKNLNTAQRKLERSLEFLFPEGYLRFFL